MNTFNVKPNILTSLSYSDRVENALAFQLPDPPDTDRYLLEHLVSLGKIRENQITEDPKKNRKLLLTLYEQLFQESRPSDIEADHSHFAKRGKGNNAVTAMDQWSFFKPYTTTALSSGNRDKALHFCIVLGLGSAKTEKLLSLLGERYLYDASLFDNCIWYILETNGSLFDLHALYEKALDTAGQAIENTEYEYDLESRSRLSTELFGNARDDILYYDENGVPLSSEDAMSEELFLKYVKEIGHYFRTHLNRASDHYIALRYLIPLPSMYNYYLPCLSNTETAFSEQSRQLNEGTSHLKYPSRDHLIALALYERMLSNHQRIKGLCPRGARTEASTKTINDFLISLELPQLNQKYHYDAFIMELLRYEYVQHGPTQYEMIGNLLSLYQFVPYARESLSGNNLKIVCSAFDALLHAHIPDAKHPSFIQACHELGCAKEWKQLESSAGELSSERTAPNRELTILLKILESLSAKTPLPSQEELNTFLTKLDFRPIDQRYGFDKLILSLSRIQKQDTMNRVLRPFFRFIRSFGQLNRSELDNYSQAFERLYLTFESSRKKAFKNIPVTPPWSVAVATVFSAMDSYFSPMDDPKGEKFSKPAKKRLMDHQMTLQNSFSYLEVRLNLFSTDSISLSIPSQEKYPPREVPKSHKKDIWVNKFYNLHFGQYDLRFSWVTDGSQKAFSYPIDLSTKTPSQTLLFSLNKAGNQVDVCKVEEKIETEMGTTKSGKEKLQKKKVEEFIPLDTISL